MKRSSRSITPTFILLILILILACALLIFSLFFAENPNENSSDISYTSSNSSVESKPNESSDPTSSEQISSEEESSSELPESSQPNESENVSSGESSSSSPDVSQVIGPVASDDWKLILVNSTHLLPEDFTVELSYIGNRAMDSRVLKPMQDMIAAAKEDGVDLMLASSHRTVERQTTLFNEEVQAYRNQGYSEEDAIAAASQWVAVPRTSEHHTGLAFDIVTPTYQMLNEGYNNTEAAQWLLENAADYGFILRYPKDKTEITKIGFEPWHYRYVGVEAAKEIMSRGICLEEYLGEVE